jgi:hypothetical protein
LPISCLLGSASAAASGLMNVLLVNQSYFQII